jgi:hypothetical protein
MDRTVVIRYLKCLVKGLLAVVFGCLTAVQFSYSQSFALRTEEAGLSVISRTLGVSVADYDRDGDLDAYFVAQWGYDPNDESTWNRLMRNNGDGTFTDVTDEAGAGSFLKGRSGGDMGHKFGASWGDFDNDGYPDLYLTHYGPNVLLRNRGDGTFEDVTHAAGVVGDREATHSSSVWWDFDGDNDLDLYVSAWRGTNTLFENQADGTFIDVTESSGLGATTATWTSIPIDGNNDGLLDLYVVDDFQALNKFFVNNGDGTFELATRDFGLESRGNGMGVAVGDYNNDGYFDIYLTNITGMKIFLDERNPLFTNTGQGFFENRAAEAGVSIAGWGWGNEFFDCDHDGDLDLYVANGFGMNGILADTNNMLFVNDLNKGPGFDDLSESSGAAGWAHGFGLVVFDYDEDGDLDLLISNNEEEPYLYENTTSPGNWLQVKLSPTVSNRSGYGTIVRATTSTATYHRQNDGVDFLGQSEHPVHFGLGGASAVDNLVVEWPSGIVDVVQNVPSNQTLEVVEGSTVVTGVEDTELPREEMLVSAYPNPFSYGAEFRLRSEQAGPATLSIFDALGRPVFVNRYSNLAAGSSVMRWNGLGPHGRRVPDGIYLYQIQSEAGVTTGRLVKVSN